MAITRFSTKAAAEADITAAGGGELSWLIVNDGKPWQSRTGSDVPTAPELIVLMVQFKMQLDTAGLYDAAETFIAAASRKFRVQWANNLQIARVSPLSNAIKTALSQTNGAWTNLFKIANDIDPQS
jgi:hypothetical protein